MLPPKFTGGESPSLKVTTRRVGRPCRARTLNRSEKTGLALLTRMSGSYCLAPQRFRAGVMLWTVPW